MLIHQGKVLKDGTTLKENKVSENSFVVIMLSKNKGSSSEGSTASVAPSTKGQVIEQIRASIVEKGKKRTIYLGDGRGDFCPSLKLREGDHAMSRKDFPLWKRIRVNRSLIKAGIHEWSNGEELERILVKLIDTNSI